MTSSQKWSINPNLHARDLAFDAQLIRSQLPDEPEYAFRDAEIRDGIWQLMSAIEDFARAWFPKGADAAYVGKTENGDAVLPPGFYSSLASETVQIIACVASGGPSGVWGWHSLFADGEKLQALVCGIVGNVLSEQVFQHCFFGGTEEGIKAVRDVEVNGRNEDGFERNTLYASTIRSHLPGSTSLPSNFNTHVNIIIAALWTHLSPLLDLVHPPSSPSTTPTLPILFPSLQKLVAHAGLLSLAMSLDPHTVYHSVPLFKEDKYTSSTMECFNDASMRQRNMQNNSEDVEQEEQERRRKLTESERSRAWADTPLTQMTLFQGLTAYRKGGWEDGTSNIMDGEHGNGKGVVYERPEYADMGVRARVLTHGWVYCRWGRARSLTRSEALDEGVGQKVHGDAWRKGGFVNFVDVEGVVGY